MITLLEEVKSVFVDDVEAMHTVIEFLDNKTLLSETEKSQIDFFEKAEEARLKLEKYKNLVIRIDVQLASLKAGIDEKVKD